MIAYAFVEVAQDSTEVASGLVSLDPVTWARAGVMVAIGIPLVLGLSRGARRWGTGRFGPQGGLVAGKLLLYAGLATIVAATMIELGFSLTPLLGAAGVVGIAVGFASQTSVSNVIAGLFLIAERPFVVDDLVQVGDVRGQVLSVDTMSVKLRTLDNRFVRIPNETLIQSVVTNITKFPIRRLDVKIGVAYKEDPERVRRVLLEIAAANPIALMEPEPIVIFEFFGESSIDLLFAVWTTRENWLPLKNSIQEQIWARFKEEGIEIPFPHRSLYVGSESEAFPIRVVEGSLGGLGSSGPQLPGGDATPKR